MSFLNCVCGVTQTFFSVCGVTQTFFPVCGAPPVAFGWVIKFSPIFPVYALHLYGLTLRMNCYISPIPTPVYRLIYYSMYLYCIEMVSAFG